MSGIQEGFWLLPEALTAKVPSGELGHQVSKQATRPLITLSFGNQSCTTPTVRVSAQGFQPAHLDPSESCGLAKTESAIFIRNDVISAGHGCASCILGPLKSRCSLCEQAVRGHTYACLSGTAHLSPVTLALYISKYRKQMRFALLVYKRPDDSQRVQHQAIHILLLPSRLVGSSPPARWPDWVPRSTSPSLAGIRNYSRTMVHPSSLPSGCP